MSTRRSRTARVAISRRLPRAAYALLTATLLATPAFLSAQGRTPGGHRDTPAPRDTGTRDTGSRDTGSRREEPAPRRDPSPSRDDYRPPQRREDPPARREDPPARRDDTPARRDETPARREDPPARRDETPARRDDSSTRRQDPPVRRDDSASRRDDINAGSSTSRDRIDAGRDAGRTTPRDDIRGDNRATERTPRTDDKTVKPEDRNGRTERNNAPAPDRNSNTPNRDQNTTGRDPGSTSTERKPADTSGDRGAGGSVFNRTRPAGENSRPDRDYRGEPYSATRRDSGGRDAGRAPYDRANSGRAEDVRPSRDRAYDIFSRSREGRQYNNGVSIRGGGYISDRGLRGYFPREYCYYPYYYPRYEPSLVYYSPYSYYYGVCAPYIYRRHCHYYPPSVVYIDVPFYVGVEFRNWSGYNDDDYYLQRRDEYTDPSRLPDRDLENAVRDLREAFRFSNINLLANLTDPSVRIAVFLRGKYEYSLDAGDYLDMTRDMFATTETIQFDLQRIRRRSADVWVVSGKQVYLNRDNKRRTVYLSFVVERVHGRWTVTQVGTAPDRIEEPRN